MFAKNNAKRLPWNDRNSKKTAFYFGDKEEDPLEKNIIQKE